MKIFGDILFFGSFLIAIFAYGYIVILSFKQSAGKGIMAFLIGPLVAVFVSEMRTDSKMRKAIKIWVISFLTMIAGVYVLSV